jgi:uncharacterized 2Fe-2S/4Fe-4S cluster protein (DUF4445 family)
MRVRFEPFGVTTQVEAGKTLLAAAIAAGVEIEAVCGGRGTCAKCKVIASGELKPLTEEEQKKLTADELQNGYRLACQAVVAGDVEVVVPEESRVSRVSILSEGTVRPFVLHPWVKRHPLQVPEATLEDQTPDLTNVRRAWEAAHHKLTPTLRALRQLPFALRDQQGNLTLIAADDQVIDVHAGDAPPRVLGVAVDIGSTTVVGYLMDLETGQQLAVSSLLNPQTRYGDDVVSRIDFATNDPTGLETLQSELIKALNTIIAETTRMAGVSAQNIYGMCLVGNTTMYHLFLGISPSALARAPYVPAVVDAMRVAAHELGLAIHPDAHVWVLPNIAGWVGADTVGVILSTGMYLQDDVALAIDIGTNGEMALGSRQRLITCSTAAGPAFEGAQLSCGMRAAGGAIDTVKIDGDVHWHAIGDSAPRGICGSGLVDLIAEMLRAGVIDSTGMMQDSETLNQNGQHKLAERIVQEGRQRVFELVRPSEGAAGRTVRVTQRDVRELQLAKGAIRAGIEILMKELGIGPSDVKYVYLAGAFGNYIKPESALAIGLIPDFPQAQIVPVGNAAGSGAKMALLSVGARNEATEILRNVEYLELSGRPDFQEQFAEAMLF